MRGRTIDDDARWSADLLMTFVPSAREASRSDGRPLLPRRARGTCPRRVMRLGTRDKVIAFVLIDEPIDDTEAAPPHEGVLVIIPMQQTCHVSKFMRP